MQRFYSKDFLKQLKRYEKKLQQQVIEAIKKLPEGDVVRYQSLNTNPPAYRLRVRQYRVFFRMGASVIYIDKIDTRGDIYKK